ncbi:MAG: LuxR C-terminal-related transcriptional regulator [Gemmatimonadaceae bacterium]|nr:LuxR C-terminal-related transcriptional regulator [Gemmatimonadaceae bacterium]
MHAERDAESDPMTGSLSAIMAAFLFFVVVAGVVDLVLDRPASWLTLHVAWEVLTVVVSLSFSIVLFRRWRASTAALRDTQHSLAATTAALAQRQQERDAWRASAEQALQGFGAAIDGQFTTWQLTRAEREVALLLLKGLGHKQVAAQLGRSERTVRQQAVDVYRKAGVQGRSELAAFFLQDVSLPGD